MFLDVLGENPDAPVNTALSGIYRRQLKFSLALQYAKKMIDASPASNQSWNNLSNILGRMGDYTNSMKASIKMWELSRMESDARGVIYTALDAGFPLDQLPDELKMSAGKSFELMKLEASRNWQEMKKMALQEKNYEKVVIAFLNMGHRDSARYWAQIGLRSNPRNSYLGVVAAPDVQHALDFAHQVKFLDDPESRCWELVDLVTAYQHFGQFEQATAELVRLNREFPDFNDYAWFNSSIYVRIKKEYPPFGEALKNLKRKPMPDVSTMMKW